jgi:hypothetical protein
MLYEVRIGADSDQEFADALAKIVQAIKGIPANGNVFSFSRYQDTMNYALNVPVQQVPVQQAPEPLAPAKRGGRPAKAATATVVDGPDGEPAAVMEESPFGAPPPEVATTPLEKREKAIALLQSVFASPAGPPLVRALQNRLKVKKFNEVTDAQSDELLAGAEKLAAQIHAAAAA